MADLMHSTVKCPDCKGRCVYDPDTGETICPNCEGTVEFAFDFSPLDPGPDTGVLRRKGESGFFQSAYESCLPEIKERVATEVREAVGRLPQPNLFTHAEAEAVARRDLEALALPCDVEDDDIFEPPKC